jgi:hypothetical protein
MIHPADEDDSEAQDEGEDGRQEVLERQPQVGRGVDRRRDGDPDVDDEQGERDGKHPVTEGLESGIRIGRHPSLRLIS